MPELMLNLSSWIERRSEDIGPYANHIVHSVQAYEREIDRLRKGLTAIDTAMDAGDATLATFMLSDLVSSLGKNE
jgi:DNA-binding ferritin-like protein